MVDAAIASSAEVSEDPVLCLPGSEGVVADLDLVDTGFESVPQEEKIKRALELESTALEKDSRIKRVRDAEYSEHDSEIFIINSNGVNRHSRSTVFMATIMAVAEKNGDSQMAFEFDFNHFYDKLDHIGIAESAADRALRLLGGKPVPGCQCPVILSAETASELLGVTTYALTAEAVDKGKSWLAGKDGKQVFSPVVTIIDDGKLESAPESFPFDGEGVPTCRSVLINSGRLEGLFFDTYYACKMGRRSTGNGVRSDYAGTPRPGAIATYIEPGSRSVEELIASVDKGFFVDELMGVHMADPISGEFSLGCRGWAIEDGVLAEPVTGMAVAGTLEHLWHTVAELGNNLKFFGNHGSPAVLIEHLTLSGK